MNLLEILESCGIDSEVAKKAESQIKTAQAKEFIPKEQYNKKISDINTLKGEFESYKEEVSTKDAELSNLKKYKNDYEKTLTEFNNYKKDIETKETNTSKLAKIKEGLKNEGFNEKVIGLLTKEFKLDSIEIEEDKIKGWEDLTKPLKEEYKDFITKVEVGGAKPSRPPAGIDPGKQDPFLMGFNSI